MSFLLDCICNKNENCRWRGLQCWCDSKPTCGCPAGLFGNRCQYICNCPLGIKCSDNDVCKCSYLYDKLSPFKCFCAPNFSGANCERFCDCVNGFCSGLSGKCQCFRGFTGDKCNKCDKKTLIQECSDDVDCYMNHKCINGNCACVPEKKSKPNKSDRIIMGVLIGAVVVLSITLIIIISILIVKRRKKNRESAPRKNQLNIFHPKHFLIIISVFDGDTYYTLGEDSAYFDHTDDELLNLEDDIPDYTQIDKPVKNNQTESEDIKCVINENAV